MSRLLVVLMFGCLVLGTVSGCGPELSEEELGEVQTSAGELPGAGEKYQLPEADFPQKDDADAGEDV